MCTKRPLFYYDRVRSEAQRALYQGLDAQGICMFCREGLAATETPILDEGDHWVIVRNKYPYEGTADHLLGIPKLHIENCGEVSPETWGELFRLFGRYVDLSRASIAMRSGEETCSTIAHFHVHAIVGASGAPPDETIRMDLGYKKK